MLDTRKDIRQKGTDTLLFPSSLILLWHISLNICVPWVGAAGRKEKGSQVVLKWFFHPVYYLICTFSLMSNCFHSCLKMMGLPRHLPELCLSQQFREQASFQMLERSCLPTYSTKNMQEYVCRSSDVTRWTFEFFFFNIYLFIYLVAQGLSCGTWAP